MYAQETCDHYPFCMCSMLKSYNKLGLYVSMLKSYDKLGLYVCMLKSYDDECQIFLLKIQDSLKFFLYGKLWMFHKKNSKL